MVRINLNSKGLLLSQAAVLAALTLLLCFRQTPCNSHAANAQNQNTTARVMNQRKAEHKKILSRFPIGNFQISLEMKENVDFLLTPAILMQDAISDDIVITYPTE
ncbi:MAG: hypothetical protein ACFFDT_23750 [Candidatus Hodarchaeota archaeon]